MVFRPTGTVTFLFTDIEGSTRLWEADAGAARQAVMRHDEVLTTSIEACGGRVFKRTGDGVCAAFATPAGAVEAALRAQAELQLSVRMGIWTGDAELVDGDYLGPVLNRAAHLMHVAHGGQVLVGGPTAALLDATEANSNEPYSVRLLGHFQLAGIATPVEVHVASPLGTVAQQREPRAVRAYASLPQPLTSFIGRRYELAELDRALDAARVVTIVGTGGIGKTRLAIELARRLFDRFDGTHFVDLAPATADGAVVDAVCRATGLTDVTGDAIEALITRLAMGRNLLVLDNCEHVTAAVSGVTEQVASRCSEVRFVVTSRVPLRLPGVHRFDLGPLTDYTEAADLLRHRANSVGATVASYDDGAAERLCAALDGVPLALELAAPWLRTLSCDELVERLAGDTSLLDEHASSDAAKTMRSTIEWSLDLLDPATADAMYRLCVFPGGATIGTLEAFLGAEAARVVAKLVDVSLLLVVEAPGGRRFRVLEPVREFCLERLTASGDVAGVRRRAAEVMSLLAAQLADKLSGPDEVVTRRQLEDELGNLEHAVRAATEVAPEVAVSIVRPFVSMVSYLPAAVVRLSLPVADLVDWPNLPDGLEVAALAGMARTYLDADPAGAILVEEVAREAAQRNDIHPAVPLYLGVVSTVRGDPFESVALYIESAERARRNNQDLELAEARTLEAAWRWFTSIGHADDAVAESLSAAQRLGGPSLISLTEAIHGCHLSEHSLGLAEPHFDRALRVGAPSGYGPGVAEFMLGIVHATGAKRSKALRFGQAALHRFVVAGLQMEVGMALAAITSILTILRLQTQAAEVAAIVTRHYPPIAAMPAFARWLEAAPSTENAESPLTVTREQAVSAVNSLLADLLHDDAENEQRSTSELGDPAGWTTLTRAERRVAELVSAGMTNREIAAQQVVSVRTIDTHVAHVLRKLGIRSRIHLAGMRGAQQDR